MKSAGALQLQTWGSKGLPALLASPSGFGSSQVTPPSTFPESSVGSDDAFLRFQRRNPFTDEQEETGLREAGKHRGQSQTPEGTGGAPGRWGAWTLSVGGRWGRAGASGHQGRLTPSQRRSQPPFPRTSAARSDGDCGALPPGSVLLRRWRLQQHLRAAPRRLCAFTSSSSCSSPGGVGWPET